MVSSAVIHTLVRWALVTAWTAMLVSLPGCATGADRLDADTLRRQYPEQAGAILAGRSAFEPAEDSFEAAPAPDALADLLPGRAGALRERVRPGLRARLPGRGDGAVRFTLPDGLEVRVREIGATGEGALAERAVVYARPDGASFWTATEDGYEEWLMLEASAVRRDAPVAQWEIDGAELRQAGEAVELADAESAARIRVTAPEAYAAGGRPIGTRLAARGARVELWIDAEGEAALVDPGWKLIPKSSHDAMQSDRESHTATPLKDGRVLVIGGLSCSKTPCFPLASAELFNPGTREWEPLSQPMSAPRAFHTATLLRDGRVLVAGGLSGIAPLRLADAELFDPTSQTWTPVQSRMHPARFAHTATLLEDGRVLVVGGASAPSLSSVDSAELFDPTSQTWTLARESMDAARSGHTATLLDAGIVLVTGGVTAALSEEPLADAELFDTASQTWTPVPNPMSTGRTGHTATRLGDGHVLVVGGNACAEAACLGLAELFDPVSGVWMLVPPTSAMSTTRAEHAATLLPDGRVLITGGASDDHSDVLLAEAELFDAPTRTWTPLAPMSVGRTGHTATLLEDGQVLLAGGRSQRSAELFDTTSARWTIIGSMGVPRSGHTATLLDDGRVLVAGGAGRGEFVPVDAAELFDATSETWTAAPSMSTVRSFHTATKLQDGRVLITGGIVNSQEPALDSAELFDPATRTWKTVPGPMSAGRAYHTATLLEDGRVLIAGGFDKFFKLRPGNTVPPVSLKSVELFDPGTLTFTTLSPMGAGRAAHTATLLDDGRVLVAGGKPNQAEALDGAEVFDPETQRWTAVGTMRVASAFHTATKLNDGRVLVAGGFDTDVVAALTASAELFNPQTGAWTEVASMSIARGNHTATLRSGGRVLVTGGFSSNVEQFDPPTQAWIPVPSMHDTRSGHTATLLPDGRLLVAGGTRKKEGNLASIDTAEVFRFQPGGSGCTTGTECESGFCADGVCCDQLCNVHLCEACSAHRGAAADGVCTPLHPEFDPYACSPLTGEKLDPCRSVHDCIAGFVCNGSNECVPPPPAGGYIEHGGCRLAAPAGGDPLGHGRAELGLLILAALSGFRRASRRPRGRHVA